MSDTGVVERLLTETRLSMSEAADLMGVHTATAVRHTQRGVRLAGGERLTLEHYRVGAKLFTSREAVARFLAAQSGVAAPAPAPARQSDQDKATARAVARLAEMGA